MCLVTFLEAVTYHLHKAIPTAKATLPILGKCSTHKLRPEPQVCFLAGLYCVAEADHELIILLPHTFLVLLTYTGQIALNFVFFWCGIQTQGFMHAWQVDSHCTACLTGKCLDIMLSSGKTESEVLYHISVTL